MDASVPEAAIYSGTQQIEGGFRMRWQAIGKMAAAATMAVTMMAGTIQAQQASDTVLKPADSFFPRLCIIAGSRPPRS